MVHIGNIVNTVDMGHMVNMGHILNIVNIVNTDHKVNMGHGVNMELWRICGIW